MKTLIKLTVFFFLFFLISCNNDNCPEITSTIPEDCIVPQQFLTDAITIDFKPNAFTDHGKYNVQVPENYEGIGMNTFFEGVTFYKYSKDDNVVDISDYNVIMFYNYCDATFCPPYGDILEENIPDFILFGNTNTLLNQSVRFCNALDTYGYFYFSDEPKFQGKLHIGTYYMNLNGDFFEAASFYFKEAELQEVLDIIKSIKKV